TLDRNPGEVRSSPGFSFGPRCTGAVLIGPAAARAVEAALTERAVAFATFLHLLRPQSVAEQRAIRAYRAEVQSVVDRLREAFDAWVATREVEPDHSRLANV